MRIVVRGLRKTYRSSRGHLVPAVDDLSLEVDDGELLVILGPSGSGKTTLLRCIAGLEQADQGEIVVDGRVVYSSARHVWVPPEQRGISMVFQSYALWPHMSAFGNVAYPLKAQRLPATVIQERVTKALDLVGCGDLAPRHPNELSGGQQQRVAVARAIVSGNRVVLFDEPLSSVDARVRDELRRELVALQRELGFSAVYITHDQTEAMAIGHRVAVLARGKIVELAPPRQLYRRPTSDYVAEFMGATNRFSGAVAERGRDGLVIRTPIGNVATSEQTDAAPGDQVTVFFRPEHCHLALGNHSGERPNAWPGTVERSLFLGSCTEYVVRFEDVTLTAQSTDADVLADGANVWLTVEPRDVRVISAR